MINSDQFWLHGNFDKHNCDKTTVGSVPAAQYFKVFYLCLIIRVILLTFYYLDNRIYSRFRAKCLTENNKAKYAINPWSGEEEAPLERKGRTKEKKLRKITTLLIFDEKRKCSFCTEKKWTSWNITQAWITTDRNVSYIYSQSAFSLAQERDAWGEKVITCSYKVTDSRNSNYSCNFSPVWQKHSPFNLHPEHLQCQSSGGARTNSVSMKSIRRKQ